jgi:hypothetical protein
MEDKIFRIAIIFSLVVHLAVCVRFYVTKQDLRHIPKKDPEVSYQIERPVKKVSESEMLARKVESIAPKKDMMGMPSVPQPSSSESFFKEAGDMGDGFKMFDRKPERIKGIKVTKEVAVPMLKSEKINTPSYVTHYQIVRDRIRERAYTNYTKLSVGEVYLTFIIRSDGTLVELKILPDKTTANEFLEDVGVKSVQEAGPFPPFPQDLNYPELTFNVSISFQYKEE